MKVMGMGGHEEFSNWLAMAFWNDDSEGLGVTMLFGVNVEAGFDDGDMTRRE